MKKKFTAVMMVLMMSAAALVGCGSSETKAPDNSGADNSTQTDDQGGKNAKTGAKGYAFEANGVKIYMDMDLSEIQDKLGEPLKSYTEASCAAQGDALILTYAGYEILTYPDGEKNMIGNVILKDDTVSTPEGLDLSMTKADVIAAYGEDYTEDGTALVYEKDGMKLIIILDGDNIASIEYISSVLG